MKKATTLDGSNHLGISAESVSLFVDAETAGKLSDAALRLEDAAYAVMTVTDDPDPV